MKLIEIMKRFRDNPENPKNVQIPFYVVVGMKYVLEAIDVENIEFLEEACKEIHKELASKMGKILNRQAYTEYIRASKSNKQEALDNYIAQKQSRKNDY